MRPDDIDRAFAEHRASVRRMHIGSMIVGWGSLLLTIAAIGWALTHPQTIGAFVGHVVAGFHGAAR